MNNVYSEPIIKRAIAFFDGQNLYHHVKEIFGYTYPNYDPQKLSKFICAEYGWELSQVRFYTGIPAPDKSQIWFDFWTRKLQVMGTRGTYTFKRELKYQEETIIKSDGSCSVEFTGREKGIDVRIAIDIVSLAIDNAYDVAIIFSQDQDLSEVAKEIRKISQKIGRWIKIVSVFPSDAANPKLRGINGTDWIKISKEQYERCIDTNDYRKQQLNLFRKT